MKNLILVILAISCLSALACSLEESPAVTCGFIDEVGSKQDDKTAVGVKSSKAFTEGFYSTSCTWVENQNFTSDWKVVGELKDKNAKKMMIKIKDLSKSGAEVCIYQLEGSGRDKYSVELRNGRSTKEILDSNFNK